MESLGSRKGEERKPRAKFTEKSTQLARSNLPGVEDLKESIYTALRSFTVITYFGVLTPVCTKTAPSFETLLKCPSYIYIHCLAVCLLAATSNQDHENKRKPPHFHQPDVLLREEGPGFPHGSVTHLQGQGGCCPSGDLCFLLGRTGPPTTHFRGLGDSIPWSIFGRQECGQAAALGTW